MDSQGGGNQAQSKSELVGDDQSVVTGNAHDIRDKYEKIKNVFKMLIQECPYLIDDKALEKCEGQSLKQQFSIKIDSIRKSLGIEQMTDVELLVDTLYGYQAHHEKLMAEQQKKWDEEDAEEGVLPGENNAVNEGRRPEAGQQNAENTHEEEEGEEEDPNKLKLDLTLLVAALQKFHKDRDYQAIQKGLQNMGANKNKKQSKF